MATSVGIHEIVGSNVNKGDEIGECIEAFFSCIGYSRKLKDVVAAFTLYVTILRATNSGYDAEDDSTALTVDSDEHLQA